jgi:hypothetical protein
VQHARLLASLAKILPESLFDSMRLKMLGLTQSSGRNSVHGLRIPG